MKQLHKMWLVLITRPKSEKKVASQLQQLGMEAFCPVRKEMRFWSDRKKKIEIPLLPSMVLVNLEDINRNTVFAIAGVKRYLFWLGKPAVVRQDEIKALKTIQSQNYKSLDIDRLTEGSKISLREFGFQQEKGTVKYISANQCWVVLHSLGYVIKLHI
jgi:transcription antitermination factor NusG